MKKIILCSLLFLIVLISCSDDGKVNDGNEVVLDSKETAITSASPLSGKKNSLITIKGINLGTNSSDIKVFFGTMEAIVQSVKEDEIVVLVPSSAPDEAIKVVKGNKEFVVGMFEYIPTVTVSNIRKGQVELFPNQLAIDKLGNVYFTVNATDEVDLFSPSGMLSNFVKELLVSNALAITTDNSDNVYVSDLDGYIWKVLPSGVKARILNNSGNLIRLSSPSGMCFDSKNNLFVTDFNYGRIIKVTPAGVVSIFVGSDEGFADGDRKTAKFYQPNGIVSDKQDNLYVADYKNNRIRKITPDGIVTTLAGSSKRGRTDGMGLNATFDGPRGITIDKKNNLFITDYENNSIRRLSAKGKVTTIAGGSFGFKNGDGDYAEFARPNGIAITPEGIIFVADEVNGELRKIILE
jgi:sugar lactone lactonase YvrE